MVSVNGHDLDGDFGTGARETEGEGVPGAEMEDVEKREIEVGEPEGEELGGDAGAEEGSLGPGGGEALGVVGVQVC
ncbi:hypothetical protein V6N13_123832 [Hibiscus sabdariffa]